MRQSQLTPAPLAVALIDLSGRALPRRVHRAMGEAKASTCQLNTFAVATIAWLRLCQ